MGGSGSGRWRFHTPRQTVESGLKLSMSQMVEGLDYVTGRGHGSLWGGTLSWGRNGEITDRIGYQVENVNGWPVVRLRYTTTRRNGEKHENDYTVQVSRTTPHFGGRRWWWICPLLKNGRPCNRRVAKLYLPGGAYYFGCRHCYDLTYRSCQESHKFDSVHALVARGLQDTMPGITGQDVSRLWKRLEERYRERCK